MTFGVSRTESNGSIKPIISVLVIEAHAVYIETKVRKRRAYYTLFVCFCATHRLYGCIAFLNPFTFFFRQKSRTDKRKKACYMHFLFVSSISELCVSRANFYFRIYSNSELATGTSIWRWTLHFIKITKARPTFFSVFYGLTRLEYSKDRKIRMRVHNIWDNRWDNGHNHHIVLLLTCTDRMKVGQMAMQMDQLMNCLVVLSSEEEVYSLCPNSFECLQKKRILLFRFLDIPG
jgi:hypothetical protein